MISIHTPTKGATLDCNLSVSLNKFQSTLPQRERPVLDEDDDEGWKFQSTLPQRERLPSYVSKFISDSFQSTLPQRERQQY